MSDAFEDGEPARLYRDVPKTEPPPALDAAILAAARREVGAGPRWTLSFVGAPFFSRWRVPLSVAAVVVISASLVFLVERERTVESEYLLAPSEEGVAQPAPRAGQEKEPKDLIGAPAPVPVSPALPAAGTVPILRQRQPEPVKPQAARSDSPAVKTVGETGAAAAEMQENRVNAGSAAGKLESSAADQPLLLKQNMPPPAASQILPLHPAEPAAATGSMPAAAPHAVQPAALSAPAAVGPVDMKRRDASGEVANEPRAARASAMKAKADTAADSPEASLARIEALRREGKLEEADRSLTEFRKRYPDYPLPAHLKTP
jgi:hypothetical protein